jgi:hypothetical protein
MVEVGSGEGVVRVMMKGRLVVSIYIIMNDE